MSYTNRNVMRVQSLSKTHGVRPWQLRNQHRAQRRIDGLILVILDPFLVDAPYLYFCLTHTNSSRGE